jgi:hypothetical protein
VLPYIAAVVSAAFAIAVAMRYQRSRRPALLAWAIGLGMFAVAALAGALARGGDPSPAEYQVFYALGGIMNVAWLALGTVLILVPRFSRIALVAVLLLSAAAIYAVATTPVDLRVALDTGKGFPDGSLPRILAAIGSGIGSLILIGGALWSAWVFLRRRRDGRRAVSNIVIAVGVLIVAAGGTVTFTGANGVLETTNVVGLCVMFAGFLLA